MAFTDTPQSWEPASFASPQRAHAFVHYRDLPVTQRSIRRAYDDHHQRCLGQSSSKRAASGRWFLWASEDDWVGRVGAWDSHLDALRREKVQAEQRAVIERHQRALNAATNVVLIPTKALLTRYSTLEFEQELAGMSAISLLRESLRANALLPALVLAERAAHGLVSPVEVVLDDRRELERRGALADAIAASPRATAMACDLLDEIARMDDGMSAAPAPAGAPSGGRGE
jgi:hypothetical protein